MKQKTNHTKIENIKIKPIDMCHHRLELRKALLTSSYWDKHHSVLYHFLKGGEEIMKKNKFTTAGITFVAIAATVISMNMLLPNNTKTAYAEEVAQKSYQKVASLTSEEQETLEKKVKGGGDLKALLEKAKNAKDLKVLSYDEFAQQAPVPPERKDGKGPDVKSLQFLQFTDTDGSKVIVGVDPKTNLPVAVLISKGDPANSSKPESRQGENVSFEAPGKKAGIKVEGSISTDENGTVQSTFIVNGKKYTLPEGTNLSDEPPIIKMQGNDVYINGQKAILAE